MGQKIPQPPPENMAMPPAPPDGFDADAIVRKILEDQRDKDIWDFFTSFFGGESTKGGFPKESNSISLPPNLNNISPEKDAFIRLKILHCLLDIRPNMLQSKFPEIAHYTGGMKDDGGLNWYYCLYVAPLEELYSAYIYFGGKEIL